MDDVFAGQIRSDEFEYVVLAISSCGKKALVVACENWSKLRPPYLMVAGSPAWEDIKCIKKDKMLGSLTIKDYSGRK